MVPGGLRAFDVRFLLPELPGCVTTLGLPGWPDGTAVVGGPATGGTFVVAPRGRPPPRGAGAAAVLFVGGRARRAPAPAAGARRLHLLAAPDLLAPRLVVCLEHPVAASYALRAWSSDGPPARRARNAVAGRLARLGWPLRPFASGLLDVGPGPPAIVAAAAAVSAGEIDPRSGWFLTAQGGDDMTRPVLHLVRPGDHVPSHAVKLSRRPGNARPFDEDERALALVGRAGPKVAARAPRLVARVRMHGYEASVETSAPGITLDRALRRGTGAPALVDAISAWVLELGAATARPCSLGPELTRLGDEVLVPRRLDVGLLAPLVGLPGVLQHNDLDSWNIHADADGRFTVLDWESARVDGVPLWDLAYFLGEALPLTAGAGSFEERAATAVEIFAGRHELSAVAFGWIGRGTRLLSIPDEAVGPAVLTGWLHHAASHVARATALRHGGATVTAVSPAEHIADRWLADPDLGMSWRAWLDRR